MTDHQSSDRPTENEILPEIKTRRMVLVNDADEEQAVAELTRGVVELRLGGCRSGLPCEALIFAGEVDGEFVAGVELWANGNSVAGSSVTVVGGQVEYRCFDPDTPG